MRDLNALRNELRSLTKPTEGDVLTFTNGKPIWTPPAESGSSFLAINPTDVAVNSVTDVTIGTLTVTDLQANDQLWVYAWFNILNNSAANRDYTWTVDFDGAFDNEFTLQAVAASATNERMFMTEALLSIRSTSLAYAMIKAATVPASTASGGDVADIATASPLFAPRWGTTASDLTGSVDVTLKVRSSNATATQTCRLHSLSAVIARP